MKGEAMSSAEKFLAVLVLLGVVLAVLWFGGAFSPEKTSAPTVAEAIVAAERARAELVDTEKALRQAEEQAAALAQEAEQKERELAVLKARQEAERKAAERALRQAIQADVAARQEPEPVPTVEEIPAVEKIKCHACRGLGTVACTRCRWSGKVKAAKPCPLCGGVIQTCPTCIGAGTIQCGRCRARGTVIMEVLEDVRNTRGPTVRRAVACPDCGGDGRVPCPNERCEKGVLMCARCRNRGTITVIETCPVCNGKYRVECPFCKGAGEVEKPAEAAEEPK